MLGYRDKFDTGEIASDAALAGIFIPGTAVAAKIAGYGLRKGSGLLKKTGAEALDYVRADKAVEASLPSFQRAVSYLKKQPIKVGPKELNSKDIVCLLYTSPSPRDRQKSRMPSSA